MIKENEYSEHIEKDNYTNREHATLIELQSENKVDKSAAYFKNGFNCSQAVFTTFAIDYGIPEEMALKVATQFGGGARKGEMCGAVTGALMVLGLKYGHFHMNAPEEKGNSYKKAEEFMNCFIEKNGTVVCRELLGYDISKPEEMSRIKELDLFKSTCPKMIQCATEIVEQMLKTE